MARPRSPRCPDCGSTGARPIIYGEPASAEIFQHAERGEVVLGGCCIGDDDPAWDCLQCGRRFGDRERPRQVATRSRDEWLELISAMLPQPVTTSEAGELMGGDPVAVMVRVDQDEIVVMEASWEFEEVEPPTRRRVPFATVPHRTHATRVAELIVAAWGKRLSRYRWCPRCRDTVEPERIVSDQSRVCHGCAYSALGVVF